MPRRSSVSTIRTPRRVSKTSSRWAWWFGGLGVVAGFVLVGVVASHSSSPPPLEEARRALSEGRGAAAERALVRASKQDPTDPIAWCLRLELLRLEERRHEAGVVGREALAAVRGPGRRDVLKALTLALLADVPDDTARSALRRFLDADPADTDARVALSRRFAMAPRPGDPGPVERVSLLEGLLDRRPEHAGARAALIEALLDVGEPGRAERVLDGWPETERDAAYDRLKGRLALEHRDDPRQAVEALERAVSAQRSDWSGRYLLARARHALGDNDGARHDADIVGRLREALAPETLGPRLDKDLAHLDDPAARRDLADLCTRVGLDDLARSWLEAR